LQANIRDENGICKFNDILVEINPKATLEIYHIMIKGK